MREIKPIPLSHIDEAASIEAACLGSAWSAEQLADSVGRPDFCYIGAFEDGILTANRRAHTGLRQNFTGI